MSLVAALVQVNASVGALVPNAHKIARLAREAAERGARLIAVPELALSGYPPEDLVLKKHFTKDCDAALRLLAKELPKEAITVVGTPRRVKNEVFNAAAIFAGGKLLGFYHKMLLPNYGVFDEKRVFAAGQRPCIIEWAGLRVGLHICEDSWDAAGPAVRALRDARVQAVLNISASPYHRGKLKIRQKVLGAAARAIGAPLLYANLVGGQDELVFDGASMALDARGRLIARAAQFREETLFVEVPTIGKRTVAAGVDGGSRNAVSARVYKSGTIAPALDDLGEVYAALKLGLRDYVDKNGFSKVVLGVSGGIDSALVATLCVDALGADRVIGVTMPSRYSSNDTLSDALLLGKNLGIEVKTLPIKRLHDEYLKELAPLWPNRLPDVTEENLQARIRGNIVMALSNKFGWLAVTTGNKSEIATGYCTLYGDMAGGFSVIKDVPKTLVWALSRWRNKQEGHELIPESTIDRPPTAELRENQKDQDTLPPYPVLDGIIERYVEQDRSVDDIVRAGFESAVVKRVVRMIDRSEYKRRQGAPGVKITPKAFGRDRRLPITNLYGERA